MPRISLHTLPPPPVDAPAPEPGVIEAIQRLDSDLVVIFSRFLLDPAGKPGQNDSGNLAVLPRWNVLVWNENYGRFFHIKRIEDEDCEYRPLDWRAYKDLEADCFRILGHKETMDRYFRSRWETKENHRKKTKELREDWAEANAGKIREAASDPMGQRRTHRDKKIFSYGGQISSKGAGTVEMSPEEQGYVSPNWDDLND